MLMFHTRHFAIIAMLLLPALTVRAEVHVKSVSITVSDMDKALKFYTEVLPFETHGDIEVAGDEIERLMGVFGTRARVVTLELGDERLQLVDFLAPEGRPYPNPTRSNDEWFQHMAIIVNNMDAAYAHLRQHNVQHASTGPQTLPAWNQAAAGIKAFYFRDPDGHFLEILEFPEDKGDARWHEPTDQLFLGIDHSAIVVDDTDESLAFYRDVLGYKVAGGSENYGPEQERLNNVFGARLRITRLEPDSGIAVEFLEYLAPSTGRPMPDDTQANDVWHWRIRLSTSMLDELTDSVEEHDTSWVSPGRVIMKDRELGFRVGMMFEDPDGHAILLHDSSGDPRP